MLELVISFLFQFVPTTNTIVNSSYYNIQSYSQIYQLTNAGSGGLEELFIMIVLWFIIGGGAMIATRIDPAKAFFAASLIMSIISTIAQSIFLSSGGLIGESLPVVFLSTGMLLGLVIMLAGFRSPYG